MAEDTGGGGMAGVSVSQIFSKARSVAPAGKALVVSDPFRYMYLLWLWYHVLGEGGKRGGGILVRDSEIARGEQDCEIARERESESARK